MNNNINKTQAHDLVFMLLSMENAIFWRIARALVFLQVSQKR